MTSRSLLAALLALTVAASAAAAPTVRIKDIATVRGLRGNQILGLGLVTGLNGKGDSSSSSLLRTSLSSLVSSFGISIAPKDILSKNAAVVMVSGELPPFARVGDRIDVTVSSIGDARDLDGGILLQCNLQAANGQAYAVAQGRVMTSQDASASKTVGAISQGAIVEQEVVSQFLTNNVVSVILRNPDFVTASAVQKAIQAAFAGATVTTRDASLIDVQLPSANQANPVDFVAQLEAITVTPDTDGRVVIDASSGVIVMGEKVRIGKVAVSYRQARVSVGASAGAGATGSAGGAATPDVFVLNETTTVDDFVTALKAVGLKADTIIAILQAVEKAGALFGSLVIN
ncbi:MAG TPA: flagellar basal body P-ring protein FlgI [Spirochaetia bacterium]